MSLMTVQAKLPGFQTNENLHTKYRIKIPHCGGSRISPASCLGRIYLNLPTEVKKPAKFTCSSLVSRPTPDLATVLLGGVGHPR